MVKVKALRGVCVGIERHLKMGEIAVVDAASAQFLVSIGSVERIPETPPKAVAKKESAKADETDASKTSGKASE